MGQLLVKRLINRYDRPSIVVLLFVAISVLGCAGIGPTAVRVVAEAWRDGLAFRSICTKL